MLKSLINNKRGVSIIETSIAITILIIGIVAAAQIFPLAVKTNKSAEQGTVAANLAQSKIEEVRSQGFESIAVGTIEPRHRLSSSSTNPFYGYERQTQVEYVDSDLNASAVATGIKKITTIVYYRNSISKSEKNFNLQLLIEQK